ncbi:MAG: type II toxin-antitoxin system VapC family toxin [Pseudomonadota bacterium]
MLLLDTCAVIWLANADPMSRRSLDAVRSHAARGEVLVSPVSAWEIGLFAARSGVAFEPSPAAWFAAFLDRPGVRLAPLAPEAAIESSFLPGALHGDPADRLLVATARGLRASLVTRDPRLLAYAAAGHLRTIAC